MNWNLPVVRCGGLLAIRVLVGGPLLGSVQVRMSGSEKRPRHACGSRLVLR
jgi:hypothetical protein